jgi:alkaline phosphatase D
MKRREFISTAAALGFTALWSARSPAASKIAWRESRDSFPQGVASGDPDESSVILWTRRPFSAREQAELSVEVSLDPEFRNVVGVTRARILAESDWTCRVLVGGLKPATVYWYRFTDEAGHGSRIGRTITSPKATDSRTIRFAFVSCQSVNEGAQNAYRRMIWEDEHASPDHRLKVLNFHVPTNLDGYRMVYRAHINDPDIQDARAHFPFICIGDNHEFSWQGWQSFIKYEGKAEPAQKLRVAANQAWWEYIPSRVRKSSGDDLTRFTPPNVANAAIESFDAHGLGVEANNLTAIGSMTGYRSITYGRHVELIITDFHSYTMEDPTTRTEANAFDLPDFPFFLPQEVLQILEAGRSYNGGKPPETIAVGASAIANFRKDEPTFTVLGQTQKAWLKQQLTASKATWKIWAATNGTLDMRTDPQNLPAGLTKPWPGKGYATFGGGDFSAALSERAELYDLVHEAGVTGFVTVSGDRHSFWAGYAAKDLPPAKFQPVGVTFITGSISAPGLAEATEHGRKDDPLRPLFVADRPQGPESTINLLIKRGVRSALEYARTGDLERARALTNPELAPHLEFVDMGGHGYSVVTAGPDAVDVEFVCIPRPITRAGSPDGGALRYRVSHRAARWARGERPSLSQKVIEGDPKLSV